MMFKTVEHLCSAHSKRKSVMKRETDRPIQKTTLVLLTFEAHRFNLGLVFLKEIEKTCFSSQVLLSQLSTMALYNFLHFLLKREVLWYNGGIFTT